MPDVEQGEARRHLMAKLPTFMASSVLKKEMEKTRTSKRMQVNSGQHVPPNEMRAYIRE